VDDDTLKAKIREVLEEYTILPPGGKKEFTLEGLVMVQPGLADVMPDVGQRTWKLYYAAKAGNWPLAEFQWKEIQGLMEKGAFLRPKHEEALYEFLENDWPALGKAIKAQDFDAFDDAFAKAINQANAYHELKEKPYLVWKLPDQPPPDLQMEPKR
jgi:hypothetical protein